VTVEDTAEQEPIETVPPTAGLNRHRDLRGWLITPVLTLLLAPSVTASIGILVAEDSTSYPRLCDAVASTNGCQEIILAMFAVHARIFLIGWLLLWALPWWRGLRSYRIGLAVVVSVVLLAAPLRLLTSSSVTDLFSSYHWQQVFDDTSGTASEVSGRGGALAIAAGLMLGLPALGFLVFALRGRFVGQIFCAVLAAILLIPSVAALQVSYDLNRQARHTRIYHDPNPRCVIHSGSNDVCPGG
jgi:hypothetical protein